MKIGIVAGEASGDLLGSLLIQALRRHVPDLQFVGIAGPKMQGQGAVSLFPMEKLAVRGYVEVLRHYREIVAIRRKLIREFIANPPDLFIGVDAPDFNIDLAAALKRKGIATIHYVSPSIWAWRRERLRNIGKAVSRVLTLFPFEAPLYEQAGIPVSYVGHPLADVLPEQPDKDGARVQLGLNGAGPVIALLPGSRQSELDYHADLFVRTARLIHERLPQARFLVPLTTRETRLRFEQALYQADMPALPIQILFGHAHLALTAADAALIASGTATLEAAMLKCPMVITYKMAGLSYRLMKRKAYQPYVGLPNILAGEFVVPELLQDDATPENLAQAVVNLVRHKTVRDKLVERFCGIHRALKQDNAERCAQAILPYLKRTGAGQQAADGTVQGAAQHDNQLSYLRRG